MKSRSHDSRVQSVLARPDLALAVFAGSIALAFVFHVAAPADLARSVLEEGGPVEVASAALHLAMAAAALGLWITRRSLFGLLCLGSVFMAGREIDLHKAFTTHGVFSLKQYISDGVPLAEKLLSAGAVVVLILALVAMTRGVWSEIRRLRRERRPALAGLLTLLTALPVLKIIDGLPRNLRGWGLEPGQEFVGLLRAVEEIGELGLPLITAVILLQLWRDMATASPLGIPSSSATAWR